MKTIVSLAIEHNKHIPDLAKLVEQRAYTIDGVSDANVMDAELGLSVAELEAEVLQQARINGMGAERELALASRVRELEGERDRAKADARRRFALLDSIHASFEMGCVTSEDSTAETLKDMMAFEMDRAAYRGPAIDAALASKEHP